MSEVIVENFNGRLIAINGIGKLFYQEGFPIILSIEKLREQNIEVSLFHVADELIKNGWSAKTIISKMREDLETDISEIEKFCYATYEDQREMIFNYLFNNEDAAKEKLKSILKV